MDKLTKIAFVISLLGILLLIILINNPIVREYEIKEIDNSSINKIVAIKGKMTNINNYDNFQTMLIRDSTGVIKVISYSKTEINKTSEELFIIGKVVEYNQGIEIEATKISTAQN